MWLLGGAGMLSPSSSRRPSSHFVLQKEKQTNNKSDPFQKYFASTVKWKWTQQQNSVFYSNQWRQILNRLNICPCEDELHIMMDWFLLSQAPQSQVKWENKSCVSEQTASNEREWYQTMLFSHKIETKSIEFVIRLLSLIATGPHRETEVPMQLIRYLMPRCTRTEQQCLALFVPGSPAFCPLTNGSLCSALQRARWQQCCVRAIPQPCWAINCFC